MMGLVRILRGRSSDDSGLTLTELLVVINLLGMVLGGAYMMLSAVTRMSDQLEARQIATEEVRGALDNMTRELREAYEVADGEGAFLRAQPRRCAFYCDVNHDGTPELVEYRLIGTVLTRSQLSASTAVPPYEFTGVPAESVVLESLNGGWTGNVFTYYDRQDPPAEVSSGHSADISAVALKLVNGHKRGRSTEFVDLSTWVKVRSVQNEID